MCCCCFPTTRPPRSPKKRRLFLDFMRQEVGLEDASIARVSAGPILPSCIPSPFPGAGSAALHPGCCFLWAGLPACSGACLNPASSKGDGQLCCGAAVGWRHRILSHRRALYTARTANAAACHSQHGLCGRVAAKRCRPVMFP